LKKPSFNLKLWVPALAAASITAMLVFTFVPLDPYGSYCETPDGLPPPYIVKSGGRHAYIDINSLSPHLLGSLPYIGPCAEDIASLRSELGGFTSLEELMLVNGIGIISYQNVRVMLMIKE
jgi:hypothetical protein